MFSFAKKISFFAIFFMFVFLGRANICSADSGNLNIYFFYGNGCPHCAEEEEFLYQEIKSQYPNIRIFGYEIYYNKNNAYLLQQSADKLNISVDGVPFLVVGDKHFIGYGSLISKTISQRVEQCYLGGCPDSLAQLLGAKPVEKTSEQDDVLNEDFNEESSVDLIIKETEKKQEEVFAEENIVVEQKEEIDKKQKESNEKSTKGANNFSELEVPFWGIIDIRGFSLPLITMILGILDGFNPCALWTLLFLISLLLTIENRKRKWILGVAFIMSSAFVYFLFMSAWLNIILVLGFLVWIRIIIGLLAFTGGAYNIARFFTAKNSGCNIAKNEEKQNIFAKIKKAVTQKNLLLSLGGIIALAFIVNLVEIICSAGIPAAYTQILSLNNLPVWQYYAYISLYILFFMLDDLFIFFVSMLTLELTGITTKYAKLSLIISGIVMLIIGFLLMFKPELLMFG